MVSRWHDKPLRRGIYALIINEKNPFKRFHAAGHSLDRLVNEPDEDSLVAADDFLHRVNDKLEAEKGRKFVVGVINTVHPFYVNEYSMQDEFYFSYHALERLTHRSYSDIKGNFLRTDNKLADIAREMGYDSVVWVIDGVPTEIYFFGDMNNVKWYNM